MNPLKFIESVESSVHNLIKSWHRRQKWNKFFINSTTNDEEGGHIRAAWRNKLTKFLESTLVHIISLLLIFMDLILTILELSNSLLSCNQKNNNYYKIENVWYHWVGIGILILLWAKAMGLAIGLGTSFFKRPGYVVDGLVVIMALILEGFLERKGGGLVVIVSLWRVVRVVESAFELSDEAIEGQIEGIIYQFELLKEENTRLLEIIAGKDVVIDKLHEIIEKLQQPQCDHIEDPSLGPYVKH